MTTHHAPTPATEQPNGLLTPRGKRTLGRVAKWGGVIAGTAAATALVLSAPGCKKNTDPINDLAKGFGSYGETSPSGVDHDDVGESLTIRNLVDALKVRGEYNTTDLGKMTPSAASFDSLWGYLDEHIKSKDTHSGFGISKNTHFAAKVSVKHQKMLNGKPVKDAQGKIVYDFTQENAHYNLGITKNGDERSIVITYDSPMDPVIRKQLTVNLAAQGLTLLPDSHTIILKQYTPVGAVSQIDQYHADNRTVESDSDLTESEQVRLIQSLPGYKR